VINFHAFQATALEGGEYLLDRNLDSLQMDVVAKRKILALPESQPDGPAYSKCL